MENLSQLRLNEEPCSPTDDINSHRAKYLKKLNFFIKKTIRHWIEEFVCEIIFRVHMELNISVVDAERYNRRNRIPHRSLLHMADELNAMRANQDVDCPKCFVFVKCLWLSKHLAGCINPHQSTYSYSCRKSSRIARQRIQDGFKTCFDEPKTENCNSVRIRPKRHSNKKKKKKRSVR